MHSSTIEHLIVIEGKLAKKLDFQGPRERLSIHCLANVTTSKMTKVEFHITECNDQCNSYRMVNVYTVRDINLPKESVNTVRVQYELVIGFDYDHLWTAVVVPKSVSASEPIYVNTEKSRVTYGVNNANDSEENAEKRQMEKVLAACSVKRRLENRKE